MNERSRFLMDQLRTFCGPEREWQNFLITITITITIGLLPPWHFKSNAARHIRYATAGGYSGAEVTIQTLKAARNNLVHSSISSGFCCLFPARETALKVP
jgi:hypothetical protein